MKKFCNATVVDKRFETSDSVIVELSVPEDIRDDFEYQQGQHIPVRAEVDGETVRRTYSICSSVSERALRCGIRVQPGGVFSNYVAERLGIGDTLEIMPPFGQFYIELDPARSATYAAFVAGSGITPLLSIVKTTLEVEPGSQFVLFYGNRTRATTMFIEDLWALKNKYPDRLSLHFIMSQEQGDTELFTGRLDAAKLTALHEAFLKNAPPDDIFLCGPNPMIDELIGALVDLGYDKTRIHSERFRPGLRNEKTPRPQLQVTPSEGTEIAFVMDGQRQSFRMTPAHPSILDAAQQAGLEFPYSCKGGVCSTCRCKLTHGEVEMAVNYALEPWEIEKGFILTCQASPKTETVELSFDET